VTASLLYEDFQPARQPAWLQDEYGTAWGGALGLLKDTYMENVWQGIVARFVTKGPADALPYIGEERQLPPWLAQDAESYRSILRAAPALWSLQGTPAGVKYLLNLIGFPNVAVLEMGRTVASTNGAPYNYLYAANVRTPSSTNDWARFCVVIYEPHGFGAPPKFGTFAFNQGIKFGFSVTPSGAPHVWPIVQTWKLGGTLCDAVLVVLEGNVFSGWNFTTNAPFRFGDGTKFGGHSARLV
jgi:hypothetical protein